MGILLKEHQSTSVILGDAEMIIDAYEDKQDVHILTQRNYAQLKLAQSRIFSRGLYCYKINVEEKRIGIQADYYVGVDWLIPGAKYIYIEPKVNTGVQKFFKNELEKSDVDEEVNTPQDETSENNCEVSGDYVEVNYLKMVFDVMSEKYTAKEGSGLVQIDWNSPHILIPHTQDYLTPFLVIQFIQLLHIIVRKGLRKSYYQVEENLNNRIKGKILVSKQVKTNSFRNLIMKTYCSFEIHGLDSEENRFLKFVFAQARKYISNNPYLLSSVSSLLDQSINFCSPILANINSDYTSAGSIRAKTNPFFKEYKDALKIGSLLIKRLSYNISNLADNLVLTPPFWIDMPLLFELYVYQKLLQANKVDTSIIRYQFSTYGNALDILVVDSGYSLIIDTKYKLIYKRSQIHNDMRQVAGYARLNKVLDEIKKDDPNFDRSKSLPCLIIYPDLEHGIDLQTIDVQHLNIKTLLARASTINAYHNMYKLGVKLP
jgi:5-methylcytosine-specific restriction enzyme subunit McrC